jgi:hypothetical protein
LVDELHYLAGVLVGTSNYSDILDIYQGYQVRQIGPLVYHGRILGSNVAATEIETQENIKRNRKLSHCVTVT